MKNVIKSLISIMVLVVITNTSCEKSTGGTDSLAGSWNCRDEMGPNGYRQYSVSIDEAGAGFDSTYFVIYNFHNVGFEAGALIHLVDTVITINSMDGYSVSGKGYVSKNNKTIDWIYYFSNEYVTAYYYR
jgi:hypothetical protein